MGTKRLWLSILALAALVPALTLTHVSPALAHASFKSSNPSDLQVLTTSPAQLTMTFAQAIFPDPGTFATVTNGSTDAVAGPEMPSASDPNTLVVPLMPNMPNGKYIVFWKSTSAQDGGVTFGRMSFFVGPTSPADVAAAQPATSIAVPDPATESALNPAGTDSGGSSYQSTASYDVQLDLGPAAMMLTPDQAQGATSGELMVDMPGMGTSAMAMTDEGQPVNHHLEVHVYDKSSGAVDSSVMPSITITNVATGASRPLSDVMLMYDVQTGQSDLHFGNNLYLPDGTYTIVVTIGQENAQFVNVAVSDGSGLPS